MILFSLPICVLAAAAFLAAPLSAATVQIGFLPSSTAVTDPVYSATGSTVSYGTVSIGSGAAGGEAALNSAAPAILATLVGRDYGVEQRGTARWGVREGEISWDPGANGWTVRNGFAPDGIGSQESTGGGAVVPASYIAIGLESVPAGTLFQNVQIDLTGVNYLRTTNAWAGVSADSYQTSTPLVFSVAGSLRHIVATLPEFTYDGTGPLEIRLYGIIGSDEGAFTTANVAGSLTLQSVPEPTTGTMLAGVVVAAAAHRRRRLAAR